MRIQHNIMAMSAYRNYNTNTSALAKNLEKLSSGYKINRAGDDAAGLAISEKMRAQITGLEAASKNVKDGISLVKTAEGAMQEIQDMLNRMEYLATQSANGTYDNDVDRANLQKEVDALKTEINRIAESANFNGISLLDGTQAGTSTSPLGDLDTEAMVDGTDPSAAGSAKVVVNMSGAAGTTPGANTITASNDPDKTYDGQAPNQATADTVTFTVHDVTDNGKETVAGGVTLGTGAGAKTIADLAAAGFSVSVESKAGGTKVSGTDDTYTITTDDVVTLTATNSGATGKAAADYVTNADGTVDFTAGVDEGDGMAETKASYELTLDLSKLEGGQKISLGGKDLVISNDKNDTSGDGVLAIKGVDLTDPDGTTMVALGGTDLAAALSATFTDFDVTVAYDDATGKAKVTLTAQTAGAAGNVGELTVSTASEKTPLVDNIVHTVGEDAKPGVEGKLAQATFESDDLALDNLQTVGTQFTFGSTTYTVVSDDATPTGNQIKAGDIDADKIKELLAKELGDTDTNVDYDADGVITLTGTKTAANTLATLSGKTISVTNAPTAGTVASNTDSGWAGLAIETGTTTLQDLKDHEITVNGEKVKLSDLFNITVENDDAGKITGNSVITFEAKQSGKLTDDVMNAITYTDNASSEVRTGWDEGETAADNNTHYELKINSTKLAGGQAFTFGNDSGKSYTFDITYDDNLTGNGTVTEDKEEVGSDDRTAINLSSSMTAADQADAIKKAVEDAMGGDYNVKVSVSGNDISLTVDAKAGGEAYNLGNVRFSSEAGAFSGAVYTPYNAFSGGTEGTYAQVSYDFDISQLQSGDKLTIGSTTISVGDKTETDADGNITLSEADAQNAGKLAKAFESAGYKSGQIQIADGKLTITGTSTGQTADALSKGDGKVSFKTERATTSGGLTLQIGETSDTFNQMNVTIGDMHTGALGIDDLNISSQNGAQDAISVIKNAINYVSGIRGDLGATQNRLEHTANNLSVMTENIQDAESTIRDTDIAEEMMSYTKNNILVQSAQAMLAQANAVPQGVLQLLG